MLTPQLPAKLPPMAQIPQLPKPNTKERIRMGLFYPDTGGMKIPVERGLGSPIGYTAMDKTGRQIFWFPCLKDFEDAKFDVFVRNNSVVRPVPIWEFNDPEDPDIEGLIAALKGVPLEGEDVLFALVGAARQYHEKQDKDLREKHSKELFALSEKLRVFTNNMSNGFKDARETKPQPAGVDQFYMLGRSLYREPKIVQTGQPAVFDFSPEAPPASLADKIYALHGGRSIRLKDFAEELQLSPDDLRVMIESDPRWLPIPPPQWVRRAADAKK